MTSTSTAVTATATTTETETATETAFVSFTSTIATTTTRSTSTSTSKTVTKGKAFTFPIWIRKTIATTTTAMPKTVTLAYARVTSRVPLRTLKTTAVSKRVVRTTLSYGTSKSIYKPIASVNNTRGEEKTADALTLTLKNDSSIWYSSEPRVTTTTAMPKIETSAFARSTSRVPLKTLETTAVPKRVVRTTLSYSMSKSTYKPIARVNNVKGEGKTKDAPTLKTDSSIDDGEKVLNKIGDDIDMDYRRKAFSVSSSTRRTTKTTSKAVTIPYVQRTRTKETKNTITVPYERETSVVSTHNSVNATDAPKIKPNLLPLYDGEKITNRIGGLDLDDNADYV